MTLTCPRLPPFLSTPLPSINAVRLATIVGDRRLAFERDGHRAEFDGDAPRVDVVALVLGEGCAGKALGDRGDVLEHLPDRRRPDVQLRTRG